MEPLIYEYFLTWDYFPFCSIHIEYLNKCLTHVIFRIEWEDNLPPSYGYEGATADEEELSNPEEDIDCSDEDYVPALCVWYVLSAVWPSSDSKIMMVLH